MSDIWLATAAVLGAATAAALGIVVFFGHYWFEVWSREDWND